MSARLHPLILAAGAALTLAACGGGGNAAVPPAASAAAPSAKTRGTATITIPASVTAASSAQRSPRWVSPSTASVQINATRTDKVGYSATTPVGPGLPGCTTNSTNNSVTCTIAFDAPPTANGTTDVIDVALYNNANPYNGAMVGFAETVGATVTAGAANAFAFTVGGVIGQFPTLSPAPTNPTIGTPSTQSITYIAPDYNHNAIHGLVDGGIIVTLSDTTSFAFVTPPAGSGATLIDAKTLNISDTTLYPAIGISYTSGSTPTLVKISSNGLESGAFYNGTNQFYSSNWITPHP